MQSLQELNRSVVIFFGLLCLELPMAAFSQQQKPRLNFIADVRGDVQILRAKQVKPKKAFRGDLLDSSDVLTLAKKASLTVVCDNGSIWTPKWTITKQKNDVSQGCQYTIRPIFFRSKVTTSPTRSGMDNASTPYLISPRNTTIIPSTPTLRWNPVRGATSYRVQISGGAVNWQTEVNQPMAIYPGTPILKSDVFYQVTITARGGSSKSMDESTFLVLDNSEFIQVSTDIKNLRQQPISIESRDIAVAHIYHSKRLYMSAIDILENLVASGSKTTTVYQMLGNIYQQIGLNSLAKQRYAIGLKLAQAEGNLETEAIIKASNALI
jgi:hypothetical protein